jgi:hypothetical protein
VTWAAYEEKGDLKLIRWKQKGVDYTTKIITLQPAKRKITWLLALDPVGESVLLNYENAELECYGFSQEAIRWTWNSPRKSSSLQLFRASECPLTQSSQGSVLLAISDQLDFYTISAENGVEQSVSLPLENVIRSLCSIDL